VSGNLGAKRKTLVDRKSRIENGIEKSYFKNENFGRIRNKLN
jgi:hypothetical protein